MLVNSLTLSTERFNDVITCRLLSNRSLLYLTKNDYANALVDAEKCIEINPSFWKGHCWKAYAIANLKKRKMIPEEMEAAGLASACIAGNLNKDCLLEYKMKINYPVINIDIIFLCKIE
jgi:hypothetical protein